MTDFFYPKLEAVDALAHSQNHLAGLPWMGVAEFQIWSQIGKIAAENPDLPFSIIRDILIADQEQPVGEYQFG